MVTGKFPTDFQPRSANRHFPPPNAQIGLCQICSPGPTAPILAGFRARRRPQTPSTSISGDRPYHKRWLDGGIRLPYCPTIHASRIKGEAVAVRQRHGKRAIATSAICQEVCQAPKKRTGTPYRVVRPVAKIFRAGALAVPLIFPACAASYAASSAPSSASLRQDSKLTKNTKNGWYTKAEARAGANVYEHSCASCHGSSLQGGIGPSLQGSSFLSRWSQDSVGDLLFFISQQMPQNAPGSLTQTEYRDITAFLLAKNGATAGNTPFPTKTTVLNSLKISKIK